MAKPTGDYTVVLIGAGATLAEALPARPPRERTPPLDRTFFDLCWRAEIEGRASVRQYMRARYGIDPRDDAVTMEQVFNYLYADAVSSKSSNDTVQAFWLLIRMYAAAITRTTRNLSGTSRTGAGALFRGLWRARCRHFDVVTFNQDLVVENALEEMALTQTYTQLPWDLRRCYVSQFELFWSTSGAAPFRATTSASSPIRVLKLHGSLNWLYRHRSPDDARNALREPSGKPGCLLSRELPVELRANDTKGHRVHLLPLIVPPIFEKSGRLKTQLEPVWRAAEDALSSATRIIVFGYSFPDADFAATALLRRAFVANTALDSIVVVDPDPQVAGKVAALTGAAEVRLYRSLAPLLETGL